MDIARFQQEKLGSRPPRGIILVRKGATAQEIMTAFYLANEQNDNAGLSRFAKLVCLAPRGGRGELDVDILDLASLPDGFNEETSTTLGMYTIALAFGVDARELWPATVSGATKADAMIQHLKARGKGQGQILASIERQINWKFLPPSLHFEFDFQDDEQDALHADISDKRSQRNERDLASGHVSPRVIRERMLHDGDITRPQFEQMELDDGRLDDGTDVLALFFSNDPDIKTLLDIGVTNPFDTSGDAGDTVKRIDAALAKATNILVDGGWSTKKQKARQAIAALKALRNKWEPEPPEPLPPPKPGPRRTQTVADAQRIRNEDDYRGESEMEVIDRL